MNPKNNLHKAFTLIEMLIVIVIIGILAAALVPRLQAVQGRARDTERKVDLKSIYTANEIFVLDNGAYPRAGACAYNMTSCYTLSLSGANWLVTISGYITSAPVDPLNTIQVTTWPPGPWYTGNYVYTYGNVMGNPNANTYDLTAQLENRQDPDRCGVRLYKLLYSPGSSAVAWCHPSGLQWTQMLYEYSPDSNSF